MCTQKKERNIRQRHTDKVQREFQSSDYNDDGHHQLRFKGTQKTCRIWLAHVTLRPLGDVMGSLS